MTTPRHQASPTAIALIERFEGFRPSAARLLDGRFTIGFGHTKTAREGVVVSREDARALLQYDLREVVGALNEWVYTPLNQNQFDALVSFAFNIGLDCFRRSGVLRRVNEGSLLQAACAMELWRKAEFEGERIVVDALVRRRAAEKHLFMTPLDGWTPAPSAIVRPRVDYDAACSVPKQTPADVDVAMTGAVASAVVQPVAPVADAEPVQELRPVEPTEQDVSPAALAAENVTARLRAALPDEPPADEGDALAVPPTPPPSSAWSRSGLTTASLNLAPPEPADPAVEPLTVQSEPVVETPVEAPAPFRLSDDADRTAGFSRVTDAFADDDRKPGLFEAFRPAAPTPLEAAPAAPARAGMAGLVDEGRDLAAGLGRWPLIGLALVGLAIVAGGVFWGLNVREDAGGGSGILGWALAFLGVACLGAAVYFLLEKLGDDD